MNYIKGNHSVHLIYLHLILTTKYRHPIITEDIERDIKTLSIDISNKNGIIIEEWNHNKDHIHILLRMTPTIKISDFVRDVKSRTSREIKKTYNLKNYYWEESLWSRGYFVCSTGGVTVDVIRSYIENQ